MRSSSCAPWISRASGGHCSTPSSSTALIEEALRANPSLQAAQASLRQARENLYAESGAQLPAVTAGGSADAREAFLGADRLPELRALLHRLQHGGFSVAYNSRRLRRHAAHIESLEAQAEAPAFQAEFGLSDAHRQYRHRGRVRGLAARPDRGHRRRSSTPRKSSSKSCASSSSWAASSRSDYRRKK